MNACPHNPKYPDVLSIPSMQDALSRATLVEDEPKVKLNRALTSSDGTTKIDAPYWQGLSDTQKCAVMAHETAHTSAGLGIEVSCEGCADKIGGYFMRAWGYAPHVVEQTYSSLNIKRHPGMGHATANAMCGAQAAERAMAARGLLGLSSTSIATMRAQLAATKPSAAPATPALKSAVTVDPGGPRTKTTTDSLEADVAPPTTSLNPSGLADAPSSTTATTTDGKTSTKPTEDHTGGFAGDVVAAVLGEDARAHAVPVLIAAGIAATLAVVLVVVVRYAAKG